jgi:hypothetical protein
VSTYDAYVDKITAALRPYSTSDAWAKKLAHETQAAQSLRANIMFNYGGITMTPRSAKTVLLRYDEILSGELNWEFKPNA